MHPTFTTEIGRMRVEEMHARAAQYRLAQQARQRKDAEPAEAPEPARPRRPIVFLYRKALAVVGVSLLTVAVWSATAFAMPIDNAPHTGSGGGSVPQVSDPGVLGSLNPAFVVAAVAALALLGLAVLVWTRRNTFKLA
jgi:hypothetical protein